MSRLLAKAQQHHNMLKVRSTSEQCFAELPPYHDRYKRKWTDLREGNGILTRYGGTEFGNAFTVTPWLAKQGVPDGSVGTKAPGVDLKLSNGSEGEVLIRTPIIFSKYLFDEEATRNALDDEGYFKTGDIASKEGR